MPFSSFYDTKKRMPLYNNFMLDAPPTPLVSWHSLFFCRKPFDKLFVKVYDPKTTKITDAEFQAKIPKKQYSKRDAEGLYAQFVFSSNIDIIPLNLRGIESFEQTNMILFSILF